jgi:predicted phage terminase large subunit-like protein
VRLENERVAFDMPYDAPTPQIDPNIDRELASRALSRRRLMPFIKKFRPKYNAGWVHEDICRRLERFVRDVELGNEPRMLLMMPPRGGKSEIGSRHFPPWVLGRHPDWEIIAGSHTSSLTMSFSRYVRDLVRDPAYTAIFPNAVLDSASQSVENWNLLAGGGYLAAGVGTGITGRGAHILLLDDLVKDIEAADSPTIRDNTWEWYISTAYTRLAPGGGVLGIMCMTGDTLVLMADGTERRLDDMVYGYSIATYENGKIASSEVRGIKCSGSDFILKIKTSSGKVVRANGRHPFLALHNGELKWIRAQSLTTAHKIVTVRGSGESGRESLVQQITANSLPSAEGAVNPTMPRNDGLTDTAAQQTEQNLAAQHDSSTGMASPQQSTLLSLPSSTGCAPSVGNRLVMTNPSTGESTLPSITATTRARYGAYSATVAIPGSDILELSKWHVPLSNTYDFTLDDIVSIEPDGYEKVYDLQVLNTENFIANGCAVHNTWWNEDDWAGRIQQVMASGDGDKFEIVKYPAINETGDEYILEDETIVEILPNHPVPLGARLTRPHNTALHPARYSTETMLKYKRNFHAAGQKRIWSSLYQQNPAPDEGIFFGKNMFRYYGAAPAREERFIVQAWDFAITEERVNDYTVGCTLLQDEFDNCYVLDIRRFKSSDGEFIIDEILNYAREWDVDLLGVEDGQIWKSLFSTFERRCQERRQYPSYEVLQPLTDKLVRAGPLKGRMQAGKVYFKKDAPYFSTLEHEMLRFPAGKHDDQIDALAWAVRALLTRAAPRVKDRAPKDIKPWKERLRLLATGEAGHMAA